MQQLSSIGGSRRPVLRTGRPGGRERRIHEAVQLARAVRVRGKLRAALVNRDAVLVPQRRSERATEASSPPSRRCFQLRRVTSGQGGVRWYPVGLWRVAAWCPRWVMSRSIPSLVTPCPGLGRLVPSTPQAHPWRERHGTRAGGSPALSLGDVGARPLPLVVIGEWTPTSPQGQSQWPRSRPSPRSRTATSKAR